MSESKKLQIIKNFALQFLELDDIHGFKHTERVLNLSVKLGEKLRADLDILKIAALLHDIGRKYEQDESSKKNHAEISAEIAQDFLSNSDLNLTQENINNIIHCIKTHSFSLKLKPQSLEAKVLSDADKLDAIGAIGLYRTIGYTISRGGDIGDVIEHLENKILKIYTMLNLDISRKIAEIRHKIIMDFYIAIKNEIKEISD